MEGVAGDVGIFVVALPGVEGGVLEGAGEGEGDWPRERSVFGNFGEVFGRLFDGLTAGEENYAGEFVRDVSF